MRLYEGDPYNGLERLQRSAQNMYDDVLEIRAVWGTQGIVYDDLRHGIVRAIENCIIKTADADAVTKYERFLGISYDEALPDVEFRRAVVAAAFIGTRHIGRPEIVELMSLFTPRGGIVEFDSGTVHITVDGYILDETTFLNLLLRKLPAHLGLRITVLIYHECAGHLTVSWGAGFYGSSSSSYALVEHAATRHLIPTSAMFESDTLSGRFMPAEYGFNSAAPLTAAAMHSITHTAHIVREEDD